MPEGDSVHLLAVRLRRRLDGRRVVRSDLRVPQHATVDLAGREVLEHDTHGKHLLTRFSGGLTLHTHLRMDGSWTVTGPGKHLPRRVQPDVRVVLEVDSGETAHGLLLPVVDVLRTRDEDDVVGHLGPDPLREDWDHDEAVRRLGADRPSRWLGRCSTRPRWPAGATSGSTSCASCAVTAPGRRSGTSTSRRW